VDDGGPFVGGNTSADSSHVITETVGRMLQCISVLASVQTDDACSEGISIIDNRRSADHHRPDLGADEATTITTGAAVLASVQTDDASQERIEILSKALKHNWLGRGRTGRITTGAAAAEPVVFESFAKNLDPLLGSVVCLHAGHSFSSLSHRHQPPTNGPPSSTAATPPPTPPTSSQRVTTCWTWVVGQGTNAVGGVTVGDGAEKCG
jgi:hypothetical protein